MQRAYMAQGLPQDTGAGIAVTRPWINTGASDYHLSRSSS